MPRSSSTVGSAVFLIATASAASAQAAIPQADPLTVRASAEELLGLADRLTARGRSEEAMPILRTLSSDPNTAVRNEARFRRSKLLQSSGSPRAAAALLREILDESPGATPVRLELAQLLDSMGDEDGAWRQLRAAQAAGLPPEIAQVVDRYSEALRATRPIGASFEITIAPDSNMGRSTRSDRLSTVIGDFKIDKDSQAQSGIGIGLRGQVFRRVPLGRGPHAALVRLSGSADLYRKARFNEIAFDLAAGPELELGRNRLNLELGVMQGWYGQQPFVRAARIAGVATRPIGRRSRLWLKGSASLVDHQVNDLQDGKVFSTTVTVEHALTPTTGLSITASGDRASFRDPGYSTTGWRAGLLLWRDIGRATLTAEFEMGRVRADKRLSLFPSERSDRSTRFTLTGTFRQLGLGGFVPITRLVIERNRSSIQFYDYMRTRTEIGLVRSF